MDQPSSNAPIVPEAGAPQSFIQTWMNAVTKPNEQTFAAMSASPNAKAMTGLLWAFVGFLVEFFLVLLVPGPLRGAFQQSDFGVRSTLAATLIRLICGAPIGAIILTLFFAFDVLIVQWIAKMFGGRGTYDQLAYAMGAIAAPAAMVSGLLSLLGSIPYVGFCFGIIGALVGLYVVVLNVMAIKGVNQFGWGPAIGSLLIPALAIGLICGCLVAVAVFALGPAIQNVFQQINQSLTP